MASSRITPNTGPQLDFLACDADIVVYGGAAGGGKTFGLLLDPLRYVHDGNWRGLLCRRTFPQITNPGGLWDEAVELYASVFPGKLKVNQTAHSIRFPGGATLTFRALQHEKDVYNLQGAQLAWLGFDEGTHFTWKQFSYPISRVRNKHGLPCKVRVTTNPDADSWLAPFLAWWIDPDTGYAVPERAGVVRWLYVVNDEPKLYGSKEEARRAHPEHAAEDDPLSVAFIPASLDDTPQLTGSGYKGKLLAQTTVERERLLKGNWLITATDGLFKPEWFRWITAEEAAAFKYERSVRHWDLAATEPDDRNDPDHTAGVREGKVAGRKLIVVQDVERYRLSPAASKAKMRAVGERDTVAIPVAVEQEPAAAGKFLMEDLGQTTFKGFNFYPRPSSGDKVTKAMGFAAAVEHGEVVFVKAPWNAAFIAEACKFPFGVHDDQIDAAAGAWNFLNEPPPVVRFAGY